MTICIFAKEPIAGRVKTRLAATIGDSAAARLASAFLHDTIALVRSLDLPFVVAWSGAPEAAPADVEIWPQGDGDLGARLERIFDRALLHSRWVIALGADSPGLPARNIHSAIEALRARDAVIGPAWDGGYYLLGLTRMQPRILSDIAWSTSRTCLDTTIRLCLHGYRTATLRPWFDVDEASDLQRLEWLLRRGIVRADQTARVLGIG